MLNKGSSTSASEFFPADFSLDSIDSMIQQHSQQQQQQQQQQHLPPPPPLAPLPDSTTAPLPATVVAEVKSKTSNRIHFFHHQSSMEEDEEELEASSPFPSDTLQSPVPSDLLPGFDWAAPVDWSELASSASAASSAVDIGPADSSVMAAGGGGDDDDLKVLGVDLDALMYGGNGIKPPIDLSVFDSAFPVFSSAACISSSSGSDSDSSQGGQQKSRQYNHPLVSG